MHTDDILAAIDAQIAQWQQARELIAGGAAVEAPAKRRGRPQGSANRIPAPAKVTKRVMSAEGKARIAAAQKLRWAAQKKSARSSAKKTAPKKAAKKTVSAE